MKTNQNIRTIPIDGRAEFEREMRKIISVTKKTLKKKKSRCSQMVIMSFDRI
jgi:hypothetical protein